MKFSIIYEEYDLYKYIAPHRAAGLWPYERDLLGFTAFHTLGDKQYHTDLLFTL